MPVPPPYASYLTGVALIPAAIFSRATDGRSLALFIPVGMFFVYLGLLYMFNYRGVWRAHSEWQERQARTKLTLMNASRNEPDNAGWRVISGKIAFVFGVVLIAFGVLGLSGNI